MIRCRHIIENYNDDTTTEEQLLQVKEYYYKKKYLKRILDRLDECVILPPKIKPGWRNW